MREIVLLTLPVLVIGAVGLWSSKRPKKAVDDGKPHLTFRFEKPTVSEAFGGAQIALCIDLQDPDGPFRISGSSFALELQTKRGLQVLWQGAKNKTWGDVWRGNINGKRILLDLSHISRGDLTFNCHALLYPASKNAVAPPTPKFFWLSEKWKIDRTKIKPLNLASWPRKPLVSLREVKISRIDPAAPFGERRVNGEAIFRFEGAAMNDKTPVQLKISSLDATMGSANNVSWSKTPKKPRQRITEWTVYALNTKNSIVRVTGRVSADNRWPLGFQIEPFDFKTAKVGQKLKFKAFPVALPKP